MRAHVGAGEPGTKRSLKQYNVVLINKTHMKTNIKIVVIGGSGLIGTKLVNNLRQQGHEVVAASPSSGVNAVTGEGLAKALNGAHVVVDVDGAFATSTTT